MGLRPWLRSANGLDARRGAMRLCAPMSKKDIFGDDTAKKADDFGALLDQSLRGLDRGLKVGDNFKGEILSVGKETTFVSTGTPVDGALPTVELLDENKQLKYKKGDIVDVVVLKLVGGEIRLRLNGARGSADVDSLEDAFDMELPVDGKVTEAVKGGFRVSIDGKLAFCPVSQMDLRAVTDTSLYIGNSYEFIITKFEASGRNIVVSRRRVLEQNKAAAEGDFMTTHKIGDIVEGEISRLDTFGAFMTLGDGVEGLVHISEISWARVAHPSELLQPGQHVAAKILKMEDDDGRLRISLSIKQGGGETDPWLQVATTYPVGRVIEGTVAKKENFGLFVVVAPGLQGLLPRSKWRDSLEPAQYENKKKGEKIMVRIDEIRPEERKLTLGLPGEGDDQSWRSHTSGSSSKGLGTFADLLKNVKPGR